ncbi:MAG: CaiB/BaiF CoA-transferase family protein [Dehalococcoidia bacterium]|nr:CaiB/BaiF CoA-transferase family protein [Dehalococcoidia bacterium]
MQSLQGIRVIDLAFMAPGAYMTMILSDLGAEVIKVEAPPGVGLEVVGTGKSPVGEENRREAALFALNRGKKSIGLDLKSEGGFDVLKKLVAGADVFVEGFRPGVMKRLGCDYESASKLNPRIVYCSLSGYGQDGPYAQLPGHDINYISLAGVLDLVGAPDRLPAIPQNLIGDFAGGSLFGVVGILAALMARERTGRGQYVDSSITDGTASLMTWYMSLHLSSGAYPHRGSTAVSGGYPYYDVYETSDEKYITIGCLEKKFWENLCRVIGIEEHMADTFEVKHHTNGPGPGGRFADIRSKVKRAFLARPRDEWFEILAKADVPVGKVYALEELSADPQLRHRNMVVEITDPRVGTVIQIGSPIKLSETPARIGGLSPLLGENTEELLLGLGFDAGQVDKLRSAGAVV